MATGLQDSSALSGAPCPIMTLLPNNIILDIIQFADGGRRSHEVKLNKCLKELITWGSVDIEAVEFVPGGVVGDPEYFSLWVTEAYAFLPRGVRDDFWEYFPADGIPFTNASWRHDDWREAGELLEFAEGFRGKVWGVLADGLTVTNLTSSW